MFTDVKLILAILGKYEKYDRLLISDLMNCLEQDNE